ncbi:MAG: HAD-IA family hydrolase [Cyclobacteriaceae bacterium]
MHRALNEMLLKIIPEKFSLLLKLKQIHKTFLLSNTNAIHLNRVNEIVFETENKINLDDYFHRAYYSHLMKMRKPDLEIFEQVLLENNLIANETLFLDDNGDNVSAAQ